MNKNKVLIIVRRILLALFLVLITLSSYLHISQGGGKAPSIHALCPYGGLESLYSLFQTGEFIQKIFLGTLVLFLITLVIALLFRRSFCGLICPFGAIQEFLGLLGQKILKKKYILPQSIDRPMRYLKYVVLAITILFAWRTAGLWMSPYDPWAAYSHLPEGLQNIWEESPVGLILLIITLVGSLIYDRFFCKYLCPMGAFYGLIGKISPYKVVRNESICIHCGLCSKVCPMNIDVQNETRIRSAECINCTQCVLHCPKAGALETQITTKTIKPLLSLTLVLSLFFGGIFIAQATGYYPMLPEKIKSNETIAFSEIKGYMTIQEAAEATKTELKAFYTLFKIPESVPQQTPMKGISELVPNYSFDEMKELLSKETPKVAIEEKKPVSVENIQGSMTISEAASTLKMDISEFYELFKIPKNVPDNTPLKNISNLVEGYDFHAIKESLE